MDAVERLRLHGLRLTGSRRRMLEGIPRDTPFRAEELWATLRAAQPRLGRATVFRTLALLQQVGALERIQGPDGSRCYRLCTEGPEHHHHLTCSDCGRDDVVAGAPLADLESVVDRVAAAYGYQGLEHDIRLVGRCPACVGRTDATAGIGRDRGRPARDHEGRQPDARRRQGP